MSQTSTTQTAPAITAIRSPLTATTKDEEEEDLTFHDLPPFPSDVPTAPLLRLNLQKLLLNDPSEIERLWRASCDVGFFYLDLRDGVDSPDKRDSAHEDHPNPAFPSTQPPSSPTPISGPTLLSLASRLFTLGPKIFYLPVEEKLKYDYALRNTFFGYKGLGQGVVDSKGTKDRAELWNVGKDDLLDQREEREPNPDVLLQSENRETMREFVVLCWGVLDVVLGLLEARLGVPSGTLKGRHRLEGRSGDQVRWIKSPPAFDSSRPKSIGEHTDFGSLSMLFNRLGGLQILPPGDGREWCYVKPLKGHCVCNIGDSLSHFTAGVLRSNLHRVIGAPGEQASSTRWSLVYFSRPEDDVVLKVLEGSEVVEEAEAQRRLRGEGPPGGEGLRAGEWIIRRALGKRVGGDWEGTLGTEGNRLSKD